MYFGHKHVKTGLKYSYELVTSLKYHMPLRGEVHYFPANAN